MRKLIRRKEDSFYEHKVFQGSYKKTKALRLEREREREGERERDGVEVVMA